MDGGSDGNASDELERRLRSMILDSGDANSALKHTRTDHSPEDSLTSTNGQNNSKQRQRYRSRKDYVKLDLSTATLLPLGVPREPPPQGPRGSTKVPQSHLTGQYGVIDQAPKQVLRRPHGDRLSIERTQSGTKSDRVNYRHEHSKFTPLSRQRPLSVDQFNAQCLYLERLAERELVSAEMSLEEARDKERFRYQLENACLNALAASFPNLAPSAALLAFGSISSGFGMPGCDMDLAFMPSYTRYDMPKALEKWLLDLGYGARLLTRTRVPILKVCERPTPELYSALREERQKFDNLATVEEQENYLNPPLVEKPFKEVGKKEEQSSSQSDAVRGSKDEEYDEDALRAGRQVETTGTGKNNKQQPINSSEATDSVDVVTKPESKKQKTWYREKRLGPLDFPKDGIGIQCDINFSNSLGLHNSMLLRCYSHCDIRVRLIVLFVKKWAKLRKINSSYSGTLSSYGFALMALHFLVNVAKPPVCPNLQLVSRRASLQLSDHQDLNAVCEGYDVRFWRNEAELKTLATKGMLGHNREPLGRLLRDFFHYYAHQGHDVPRGGFGWAFQVLSLRTEGGILSKQEKGWTEAKTTMDLQKEIRHRYLFAIEDPFEVDHNIARTVTHNGIVAIRDEFRRAWRILLAAGRGQIPEEGLFAPIVETTSPLEVKTEHRESNSNQIAE